jgi:hypothetical protein
MGADLTDQPDPEAAELHQPVRCPVWLELTDPPFRYELRDETRTWVAEDGGGTPVKVRSKVAGNHLISLIIG